MIVLNAQFGQENYYNLGMIGRAGENGARQIAFDCANVLREYPNSRIICICKRARDAAPYAVTLNAEGSVRLLTLSSLETSMPGSIVLELRAVVDNVVLKSALYTGRIAESLQGENDEPGNPISDTLNRLDTTIEQAKSATENAQNAAESVKGYALAETARVEAEEARVSDEAARVSTESDRVIAENERVTAEQARAAAESNRVATENARQAALTAAVTSATNSANSAESSAIAASDSATAAQEAQEAVEGFTDSIAKEPTAQQILAAMQQEMALLNQLVESGMSDKGSLNGFSFSRGDDGELIISYVNPDDETDVAMSTFATKATANLIAQELAAINDSLHTIVGAEQTTTNTEG